MYKCIYFLNKYKIITSFLLLIIFIFSIVSLKGLKISNNLDIWFPENDPQLHEYKSFLEKFGNDEQVIIAMESKYSFITEENIKQLLRIEDSLRNVQYTDLPVSITSPFLDKEAKQMLISEDYLSTMIIVPLVKDKIIEKKRGKIIKRIKEIMEKSAFDYHLAGITVLYNRLNVVTQENVTLFIVIVFAYIFILSGIILKDWRIIFLSMFCVVFSILVLMSVFVVLGDPVNMITSMLPVLILIYGLSDIVYIVFTLNLADDKKKKLSHIAVPCLLTSLTTFFGYLSLVSSRITCVKQLGFYGGVGVLIEFFVTIAVFSIFIDKFSLSKKNFLTFKKLENIITKITSKRKGIVLTISLVFLSVFVFGMKFLRVDTYSIGMLREGDIVRKDSEWIEENIGFYLPLELLVETNEEDLEIDKTVELFQDSLKSHYGYNSISINNITMTNFLSYSKMFGEVEQTYVIRPGNGRKTLRITVFIPMVSAREVEKIIKNLIDYFEQFSKKEIKASGYLPLYVKLIKYLEDSQFSSFPISILVIFTVIILFFGFKSGVKSFYPNIFPVITVLGIMGLFGIPLDVGTIIITPIVMGIVVDDTIHYLYANKHGEKKEAIKPMFITSFILSTGFFLLIFAKLTTINYFGILSAIAIVTAYFCDSIILGTFLKNQK